MATVRGETMSEFVHELPQRVLCLTRAQFESCAQELDPPPIFISTYPVFHYVVPASRTNAAVMLRNGWGVRAATYETVLKSWGLSTGARPVASLAAPLP
jgi:hypothetical protein